MRMPFLPWVSIDVGIHQKGYDITFMTDLFGATVNEDIATAAQRPYPNIELTRESSKITIRFPSASWWNVGTPFGPMPICRCLVRSSKTPLPCLCELHRCAIGSLHACAFFTDRSIISKALKIQGGFGGYNMPPAFDAGHCRFTKPL